MDPEQLRKECAETPSKLFTPHVNSTYFAMRATYFATVYFVRVVTNMLEPYVARTDNLLCSSFRILRNTLRSSHDDNDPKSSNHTHDDLRAAQKGMESKFVLALTRSAKFLFIGIPALFIACTLFASAHIVATVLYISVACISAVTLFAFFTLCTVYGNVAFVIKNSSAKFKILYEKNIATEYLKFRGVQPENDINNYFSKKCWGKITAANGESTANHPSKLPLVKASLRYGMLRVVSYGLACIASTLLLAVWLPLAIVFPIISMIIAIPTFVFGALSGECSNIMEAMDIAQQAFVADSTDNSLFQDNNGPPKYNAYTGEPKTYVDPRSNLEHISPVSCSQLSQRFCDR